MNAGESSKQKSGEQIAKVREDSRGQRAIHGWDWGCFIPPLDADKVYPTPIRQLQLFIRDGGKLTCLPKISIFLFFYSSVRVEWGEREDEGGAEREH